MAEPQKVIATRWKCPFCNRRSNSKKPPMQKHVDRCWRNPANRACLGCRHFENGDGYCAIGGPFPCEERPSGIVTNCPLWEGWEESPEPTTDELERAFRVLSRMGE